MSKQTLGEVLRAQRHSFAMTQRELANRLGVKPSHVAYLENGSRKPSLALLRRIANALDLDGQMLFFMAHPEARRLLKLRIRSRRPKSPGDAWQRFVGKRELLSRHKVSRAELRILKQVSLLRRVSSPGHFIFVLNAIRQASAQDY